MARIGVKDLYIAPIKTNTETEYSADTPIKVAKVASIKKDYKGKTEPVYYDDALDEEIDGLVEKSLEIETKEIPIDVESMINGTRMIKGMEMGSTADATGLFAVGYRTKDRQGKYTFYWHYICKAEPLGEEHETQAEKIKISNRKLKFSIMDRKKTDLISGKEVHLDHITIDESALKETDSEAKTLLAIDSTSKKIKWFDAVPEPFAATT